MKNMDALTKKAIRSGLFCGIFVSIINALIFYYEEGTFNIGMIVLSGIISSVLWTFLQRYELKKQAKKESRS